MFLSIAYGGAPIKSSNIYQMPTKDALSKKVAVCLIVNGLRRCPLETPVSGYIYSRKKNRKSEEIVQTILIQS